MNPGLAILGLALVTALPANAEVFRCVDGNGRTTYQQTPCAQNEKGVRVELTPDNGVGGDPPELVAKWTAAARQGQVLPGMPRRYVQSARGAPTEVRAGTAADRVSEIWIYRNPGGSRTIGFLDGRVQWERGEEASSDPSMPDDAGTAGVRQGEGGGLRSVEAGQDCDRALSAAGPPSTSDKILLPKQGPDGRVVQVPGMRYVFDRGDPPERVALICRDGMVLDVSRLAR